MKISINGLPRFAAAAALALVMSFGATCPSSAGDDAAAPAAKAAPEPVTTKDPTIALDDLELLLNPMSKEEVEVEAKGWFDLVRNKEREISVAEINVRRKNREIAQLDKQKAAADELAKASKDVKAAAENGGDKAAAAKKLEDAQKALAKTAESANQEKQKEEKTAEATTALTKQAAPTGDAAPAAVSDKDVLTKAAEAAADKAAKTGDDAAAKKAGEVVAAAAKDDATSNKVQALAESAPAAAATAAATAAPGAAKDTAKAAEKLATKADEAAAAKTDVKVQLVDYSTQLTSERTALVDRLKKVLDELDAKGGDSKSYRLYIASLGGLKIDVSDKAATWARVKAWLVADEGGLRWAKNIGIFIGYIVGSIVIARLFQAILRLTLGRSKVTSQLLREFVITASGRLIVALGFLFGLAALEVNLAPLLAIIGAAGFVVAFALQGTLSNFASGLLIMVFKPFDVGDKVEVGGGIAGKVTKVSVFSTHILTDDGLEKIVPNDNIWKNVIVNQSTGQAKAPATASA